MVDVFDAYLMGQTKPVKVKPYRRALPVKADVAPAGKFEPGSDIARDLHTAIRSARA
jgi:hypothetical protein